jgi:hypothetical protein
MSSTKTHSIITSFIIVPMLATSLSINAFTAAVEKSTQAQIATAQSIPSPEDAALQKEREEKAAKIDAYFAQYNMPLEGYGMKMVLEAEKHGLDWRLIPAIAVRESTGGKFACKNNPFGWGSCKIGFKSYNEAIEVVSTNLSGDNPSTAHHYDGKSVRGILETYNPPSVVPTYAGEVIAIMNKIEAM